MSKDTIKVNMNVYDIPIVVEQLKKLEQENKQLKEEIEELKQAKLIMIDYQDLEQRNIDLNSILTELEEWLEKEQDRLVREISAIYEDSLGRYKLLNEDIYKEIDKIKNKIQELKEKYK